MYLLTFSYLLFIYLLFIYIYHYYFYLRISYLLYIYVFIYHLTFIYHIVASNSSTIIEIVASNSISLSLCCEHCWRPVHTLRTLLRNWVRRATSGSASLARLRCPKSVWKYLFAKVFVKGVLKRCAQRCPSRVYIIFKNTYMYIYIYIYNQHTYETSIHIKINI